MNKLKALKIVNPILFLSFLVQLVTSLIIVLRIRAPHLKAYFEIHQYNGLLFIALILVHVYLNFGWIRAAYFKKSAAR